MSGGRAAARPSAQPALTQAIETADRARAARAQLLSEVRAGGFTIDTLKTRVADDPLAAKTKVLAVLEAVAGNRKIDVRRALDRADVAYDRPIGALLAALTGDQQATLKVLLTAPGLAEPGLTEPGTA